MKIWNLAIKQPIFMMMILFAGIVLGVMAYTQMPVNLYPNVDIPVVVVNTVYPGASPAEVKDQVTKPLEDELSTLSGLDTIQSTSAEGVSTIILQFTLDNKVATVGQNVREKVNLIRNELPTDVQDPIVQNYDPNDMPILSFSVAQKAADSQSGQLSQLQLRDKVENDIQAPLERIADVSAVEVTGGQQREIQVNLDAKALQARQLTPQQVIGALQANNINLPGGSVKENATEFLVRTPANLQTVDDVRNLVVSEHPTPIYVRDVATVTDGFVKQDAIALLNGEDAVVVNIRKQSGSNTVGVADAVKAQLEKLRTANPNLNIVVTSDQSLQVSEATDGAVEDLLYAALLAAVVMLVFFRDSRNTLVTVAGLPVIIIATLFVMHLFGITLNQISLLALALVVGLVIDDGIVVRENILRWVEKGFSPRVAASLGTAEVALPVIAIGATILAVFLPVAFASGIIGKFFLDFGLTVSIAMVISVFEGLTMAPLLSAYFFKKKVGAIDVELDELDTLDQRGFQIDDELEYDKHANSWLNRVYSGLLNWTLGHKLLTGLIALVIIVGSFSSVAFIDVSFLPSLNAKTFTVSMALPGGTPLATTEADAATVAAILHAHPAVQDVVTNIGGQGSPEKATFTVALKDKLPRGVTAKTVTADLRKPLAQVPGILFPKPASGLSGGSGDVTVEIVGQSSTDYDALGRQAEQVAAQMKQMTGLTDVDVSYRAGRPEMHIEVDRQRAADLGLSPTQIAATVRLLLNGDVATTFRGEGSEADIRVQLAADSLANRDDILNIQLLSSSGKLIPLRSVATITTETSPNAISRSDRQPLITINANVTGDKAHSTAKMTKQVTAMIAGLQMPDGMQARLGGSASDQSEAMSSMLLALLLGVIFIYMVLASQFGSLTQPLLIMLAMPLAIVGAIVALLISGRPLDMTAMIGFIMLMGLVVKNSVLLVDFANRARKKGASATEAMKIAGPVRLRPILMTSLAMILAMIPIALGLSSGGEFRQSMAIAILGGMITSTLLTLIVVPLAYSAVVGWQDRMAARRAARKAAKGEEHTEEFTGVYAGVQLPALQEKGWEGISTAPAQSGAD